MWLQGDTPAIQPLTDTNDNILLWNGDVFYNQIAGKAIPEGKSDSQFLLDILQHAKSQEEICTILDSIHGPWAIVYFHKRLNVIITGRDCFGRHSLLWNLKQDQILLDTQLILSSTAEIGDLSEVPASSLFEINFTAKQPTLKPVGLRNPYSINKLLPSTEWTSLEDTEVHSIFLEYATACQKEIQLLEAILLESIKKRISCQPMLCKSCVKKNLEDGNTLRCHHSKVAVMFSGGLDSTVLAALVDRVWSSGESIDLLNVAFPSPARNQAPATANVFNVPDRLTGLQALEELKTLNPNRKWNFVQVW